MRVFSTRKFNCAKFSGKPTIGAIRAGKILRMTWRPGIGIHLINSNLPVSTGRYNRGCLTGRRSSRFSLCYSTTWASNCCTLRDAKTRRERDRERKIKEEGESSNYLRNRKRIDVRDPWSIDRTGLLLDLLSFFLLSHPW